MNTLFTIENMMMMAFILALTLSIWKVYAFLPTKVLEDDDTTKEAIDELINILTLVLNENPLHVTSKEIYQDMIQHPLFDKKKFWRFNENRVNTLLNTKKFREK